MQNKELIEMLHQISDKAYITSEQLSQSQQIGVRTVRKRIKDLNQLLMGHGAMIESKARYGYRIVLEDSEAYEMFLSRTHLGNEELPDTREKRVHYLLFYFLDQNQYCKADDLVDQLFISKRTLSADIKQIEQIINCYGMRMERRPNYGMRVNGGEFDIRRCMAKYLNEKELTLLITEETQHDEIIELSKLIIHCASKYHVSFQEIALDQFIKALYIQIHRLRKQHVIKQLSHEFTYLNEEEIQFLEELEQNIQDLYQIQLNDEEKKYISLHFEGKRMVNGKVIFKNRENFIIPSFIDKLIHEMLDKVYHYASIDLRMNLQLILSLSQHMVPMDIRIRYGIYMENPMLDIIKEKYLLSYNIAIQAVSVLNIYYKTSVVEDEIGLLALIFQLSLERVEHKTDQRKFKILIVCNSGKALSQLLMIQFQQEFKDYIDHIYISDIFSLDAFDFSKIDYLFTTVPIKQHVPVPIQEISLFIEPSEQKSIRSFLENRSADKILSVYTRNHFFTHIQGTTKEEVLANICKEIYKIENLEEGLYDSVLRREALSSTDFGNLCAIPHPDRIWEDKTYVFVSVLDNEIQWNRFKVKVVFLILMGGAEGEQQKEFYEITTRLVTDKEAIQRLIEVPSYDTLVKGLIRE